MFSLKERFDLGWSDGIIVESRANVCVYFLKVLFESSDSAFQMFHGWYGWNCQHDNNKVARAIAEYVTSCEIIFL